MADEDKGKGTGDETVTKEAHDQTVGELDKAKQDLEDMRLEVLSPDYLDYLGTKDKGKAADEGKPAGDKEIPDDKLEKMTPKEILVEAERRSEAKFQLKLDKMETDRKSESGARTQREVETFARSHEDFPTYKPIMYGLSLGPKNKDLSLQELYTKAKEHVKAIHTEPSEAEKDKQRSLKGEKPSGASDSFEDLRKLSPEEATTKAMDEVKEKLGPIPV